MRTCNRIHGRRLPFICGVVLSIAVAASALAAQSQAPAAASRAANVASDPDVLGAERLFAAWMDGQIAYRGLPGIVVGVVSDQQLVWAKGFGYADVQAKIPMSPDTKFRMASHSKLFTAIAIMQLREDGKLRLDDPVEKYLPWFKAAPAGDDDGQITVEQLLSHSSGLQREAGDHWVSFEFPTADQLKRLYADRKAAFAPSVRWKYSNLAYSVAGMVIEQVSGKPWADYVDRNIFQPLHDVMLEAPLYATMGEHDLFYSNGAAVADALHLPNHAGRYAVDYGPVQVVLLGLNDGPAEVAFARRALARPGPRVRFVVLHRPVQPGDDILPLLRRAHVAAVIAGHLHRYERRLVGGIPEFVVGTSGEGPGAAAFTKRSSDATISLLNFGSLRVTVTAAGVNYQFVDERGRVLDHYTKG